MQVVDMREVEAEVAEAIVVVAGGWVVASGEVATKAQLTFDIAIVYLPKMLVFFVEAFSYN